MFIKQPTLWQTVKPVIIFGPILGTAVLLVWMWSREFYKNPTFNDFALGFVLFLPSVLIVSFFGFLFGIVPAIIAGALKHYVMVVKKVNAFGFTFIWFLIFGLLFAVSTLFPLWFDRFTIEFLLLPSLFTGLIYIWLEVWVMKLLSNEEVKHGKSLS